MDYHIYIEGVRSWYGGDFYTLVRNLKKDMQARKIEYHQICFYTWAAELNLWYMSGKFMDRKADKVYSVKEIRQWLEYATKEEEKEIQAESEASENV